MHIGSVATHVGYVRTRSGSILLQLPAANHWGFVLADDDQTWPGGFGWESWEPIADSEVPEDIRQRLHWLLEEVREAEAENWLQAAKMHPGGGLRVECFREDFSRGSEATHAGEVWLEAYREDCCVGSLHGRREGDRWRLRIQLHGDDDPEVVTYLQAEFAFRYRLAYPDRPVLTPAPEVSVEVCP
jgi:hypothetical protein